MFETKKKELFKAPVKKTKLTTSRKKTATKTAKNAFIEGALGNAAVTTSGNGAKKFAYHSSDYVTQFNMFGVYRKPRSYAEIAKDMVILWSNDPLTAVKFILYTRLISRQTQLWDGSKTENIQKGAGLKHEGIVRMMWLAVNHPETFWSNLDLFIACGSWKDIFEMMMLDLQYHGWDNKVLDWEEMGNTVLAGLENPNTAELVKKYLPRIRAKSACTTLRAQSGTMTGKFLASVITGEQRGYEKYRKIKSSGTAHTWQQLISKKLFDRIDFDSIHGRALSGLVSSKFLKNHGLQSVYQKWIDSRPVAKFTGYVIDFVPLLKKATQKYQKDTIDKQYETLLANAMQDVNTKSGLIVARDTSGSMLSKAYGLELSSDDVARALSVFFGDMLTGTFKNVWLDFNSVAEMKTMRGNTFSEKFSHAGGGKGGYTNFLGVAQLFAHLKKSGIAQNEFPTGVLCVSDGEFNSVGMGRTNVEAFKQTLKSAGFTQAYIDKFQFVFWDIPNTFYGSEKSNRSKPKFETFANTPNVFYMSGYSPEALGFLLGGKSVESVPTTAEELFEAAMNQEILNMVVV
jgi:hypothetical protein